MKVYLDNCSVQRPLDNKTQPRVALEAEAVLAVLSLSEAGVVRLVSSEILRYEVTCCPHPQRRAFGLGVLATAVADIRLTDVLEQRAIVLQGRGFAAMDALYLAAAETGDVDVLCTCDDRFLEKARTQTDLRVRVLSPLELAQELLI